VAAIPTGWRGIAVALVVMILCGTPGAGAERAAPRLHGTFLQLWATHNDWSVDAWRRLFGYLERLKITEIVVQWSVYDGVAFYPTAPQARATPAPIPTILRLAEERGIGVKLGLVHDPAFWTKVTAEPERVERYLAMLRVRAESTARELLPLATSHRAFRGWYITEEIEDATWRAPRRQEILAAHLRALATMLHGLTPGTTVGVSTFSNAHTPPATFGEFWTRLLRMAPIQTLMFQDGIGANKQRLSFLPLYLAAARDAARANERELQVIVEVFQQLADASAFRAVPAPLERVERQLGLAGAFSTGGGPIAFSIPEYMTPLGGPDAERLFDGYLRRVLTTSRD
jgi:hypothetical protein